MRERTVQENDWNGLGEWRGEKQGALHQPWESRFPAGVLSDLIGFARNLPLASYRS